MRVAPCALLAALATLFAPFAPLSAAERIYTWTDERGVSHYSDSPPPAGRYQTRELRPQGPPTVAAGEDADRTLLAHDAARRDNCERARQNLRTLQGAAVVRMDLDGDGRMEEIGPEERGRQIAATIAHIREYCGE